MRVIHIQRKPVEGFYSFERLFASLRHFLPPDIQVRVVCSWFHSTGFFRRIFNVLQILPLRGAVIHITGDIHYLALGLVGRKVVLTIHDIAPLRAKSGLRRKVFKYLWYTLPMRIATVTTTISGFTRRELAEELNISPDSIHIVPNCIFPEFKPSPRQWPERPVVLMVGTKANKNLHRMLAALHGMAVDVRIVGKLNEAETQKLESIGTPFKALGCLNDEQLLEAYRQCDVLGFASTYEGFGLPILEAQAIGRPVLTSHLEPMDDIAGTAAVLVDPVDVSSIRNGFEAIFSNASLRDTLVSEGFQNVQRFDPIQVAAMYAAVYQKAEKAS